MEIRRYTAYNEAEVLRLYKSVGWAVYADDPAMLKAAFAGSLLVLGAFVQDGLIGLVRGVGAKLLRAALAQYPSVYQTVLMTDDIPERAAFYRACGFTAAAGVGCCAFIRMPGR